MGKGRIPNSSNNRSCFVGFPTTNLFLSPVFPSLIESMSSGVLNTSSSWSWSSSSASSSSSCPLRPLCRRRPRLSHHRHPRRSCPRCHHGTRDLVSGLQPSTSPFHDCLLGLYCYEEGRPRFRPRRCKLKVDSSRWSDRKAVVIGGLFFHPCPSPAHCPTPPPSMF